MRTAGRDSIAERDRRHDIELTYCSNAIEGNCLTLVETRMAIEGVCPAAGKPVKDQFEALDHFDALSLIRKMARDSRPVTESDIRELHNIAVKRSCPDVESRRRYADAPRYVATSTGRHDFPMPSEIPALMRQFAAWLRNAPPEPHTGFAARLKLVDIHPFNDGNGRTARLLMNLLLLRAGYPAIAIRPADDDAYNRWLQISQAGGGSEEFYNLLYHRLGATLDEYLAAVR